MPDTDLPSTTVARPGNAEGPLALRGTGGLICLCGIDGTGKTTHARRLAARLRGAGVRARAIATVARNGDFMPTLKEVTDRIGKQTMADLIAFERFRCVRRLIIPALARKETIICDRYFYTDIVYAEANGCDASFSRSLLALAPRPDATIILSAPFQVAIERAANRSHTVGWAPGHQARFLQGAARLFDELGRGPGMTLIDTDRPLNMVAGDVYRAVALALGLVPAPGNLDAPATRSTTGRSDMTV